MSHRSEPNCSFICVIKYWWNVILHQEFTSRTIRHLTSALPSQRWGEMLIIHSFPGLHKRKSMYSQWWAAHLQQLQWKEVHCKTLNLNLNHYITIKTVWYLDMPLTIYLQPGVSLYPERKWAQTFDPVYPTSPHVSKQEYIIMKCGKSEVDFFIRS